MNKSELTLRLAKEAHLSLKDAKTAIDCLFDTRPRRGLIAAELDTGAKVTIAGFGTFEMRSRKGRTGRNPRTGQPIEIDPSMYPAFRAGVSLKNQELCEKGDLRRTRRRTLDTDLSRHDGDTPPT